jgi:hypothetical protein
MKHPVIDLLAFPRRLMAGTLALDTCPHAGHFVSSGPSCDVCEVRLEREWLHDHDACSTLAGRPLADALGALRSASLYVDACVTRAGHDRARCRCAARAWLREAHALLVRAGSPPP